MQAEAGFLFLSGEPGGPPARMGLSIIDFMSGVTAAFALVSALLGAGRTGQGRDVDICLFDVALHQLSYPATWYLNEGAETGRIARSAHPSAAPVQLYRTKDGWIFLMCMMDKFWEQLLGAMNRADLGRDARFATMADRRANRDALTEVLDEALSGATTAEWLEKFVGRLPAAPVFKMGEALDSAFVHQVGMVRANPHPLRPDFRSLANPIKLGGKRVPSRPASALGADTDAVFQDAGFSAEEIAKLRSDGVL
jgi:crotonobetainyl-CoA:carnitine CoA-transferase CaiB-like acyl-CoA transferase